MVDYYNARDSKDIPGKFDDTWWEGGSMFMTLIQYWYLTGDDQFNDIIQEGMYWQKGADNNYFPSNSSSYLGNDDQMFWGLAAIIAAEFNFPERSDEPSWVTLAQGVFDAQVARWDKTTCDGGLRWQIWPYQNGYEIKNAISNGGLFQLAARLALYTKNETFANWAETIWDWSVTTPLLKKKNWNIADTTNVDADCKDHGDWQWTYNYATYIAGAGYMYNYVSRPLFQLSGEYYEKLNVIILQTEGKDYKYLEGITGLITTSNQFFPKSGNGQIMSEITCEATEKCDRNQKTFKAYYASWLGFMSLIVPSNVTESTMAKFKTSAVAAGQQCSGGKDGKHCGIRWTMQAQWDKTTGLEQEMAVLGVLNAIMVPFKQQGPYNVDNGGESKSDPNAGVDHDPKTRTITSGDRAGAGILTAVFIGTWVAGLAWAIWG